MKISKRYGRKVFGGGTIECSSASMKIENGRSTGQVNLLRLYVDGLEIEISREEIEMLNAKLAFFDRSDR